MKYCTNCHKINKENANFCRHCGYDLGKEDKVGALFTPKKQENKTLRNIIIGAIVVFVILALVGGNSGSGNSTDNQGKGLRESTDGWENFTSFEHGFKIDFPIYPSTERIEPETLSNGITFSGTQYSSSTANDQDIYIAQAADYDIAPEDYDIKSGLEGALNALLDAEGYNLTNSSFTTFQGYDASEFKGTFDNGSYLVKGIIFIRHDLDMVKSFLLMVASTDHNNYENYYNMFINSFSLTQY